MRTLVLYLNELSCLCNGLAQEDIASYLENAILAANRVQTLRKDAYLRTHCKLGELTLGDGHFALGALLPGTNGRLAQLKRMVDKAPCGPVTACMREVWCEGQLTIGLSWADLDDSFVLSLGHRHPWSERSIPCERHTISEPCELNRLTIDVCNLSTMADVDHWTQRIVNYGKETASSSLLYRGTGFVMRMHFHDHPPPHVHIYPRLGDTNDLIARVRVDNGDIMDGTLSSALNSEISGVLHSHRDELLESWANIQSGKLPVKIQ